MRGQGSARGLSRGPNGCGDGRRDDRGGGGRNRGGRERRCGGGRRRAGSRRGSLSCGQLVDSASARRWASLVPGTEPFAYRFPDHILPDPLPAGARPLALLPVKSQASASSSTSTSAVPATVTMEDPDLGGVAGFCRWEELAISGNRSRGSPTSSR